MCCCSRAGGSGGLAGTGNLSYTQFFEPFASSTVILFQSGFLLTAAVQKHGLDRAIASQLARPFVGDSYRLVMAVILTTGFLSIWISNTATAAMMLAIVTPLARNPATPRRLGSRHAAVTLFAAADAIRCLASIPSASDVHHRRDAKPPRRLESAHDAPNDTKVHSWSYHS
mgnify:FL=1